MNLVDLASHTIDLDILPPAPVVLDAGCRGFGFSSEILRLRPGARVYAMDPDPGLLLDGPQRIGLPGVTFLREALVGDGRISSLYAAFSYGDGNFLCDAVPHYASSHVVPCVNIVTLMKRLGISYWDVVKLDVEGAEFQILENWPGPIAGQISVEFHDWTWPWKKVALDDPAYYPRLWAEPLRDYEVVRHELSTVGPGPAWGHWDSVLRLRL